jgi:hypothetical protein
MSNHHGSRNEERHRRSNNVITRAFELYDEPRLSSPRGNLCFAFSRLQALAAGAAARTEETLHLDLCGSCTRILDAIHAEAGGSTSPSIEGMPERNTMRNLSMSMPEGGSGREAIASVCTAVQRAVTLRPFPNTDPNWSIEGGLSLLKDLRSCTPGALSIDPPARRRLAADYANAVAIAPPPIKVALVYGLIVLKEARRLAVDVVGEIARRDDPLAHQVMVFTLLTEGDSILAVDSERWSRVVEEAEPVLQGYRNRSEKAVARFMTMIKPPHTLHEAKVALRRSLIEMLDITFASRNPVETILHLLAVRHFLGSVAAYAHDTYSDIAAYFPKLIPLVSHRGRLHRAPQALALEICEKLQPVDPISMFITKLPFNWTRPSTPAAKERKGAGA